MAYYPTFTPKPPLVDPETFEWSDYGGRCLIFRRLPGGHLDIVLKGDGDEDFHAFRVASGDAPNMMAALIPWARIHAKESR